MFIRAYLPQIITALFGGLFVALGILTFENSIVFDRLFLAVLIFTTIVCRHDINVVFIATILLLQLSMEEVIWLYLLDNNIFKISLYIAGFTVAYLFRYDWIVKVVIPTLLIIILTEIYWWFIEYDAPNIFWHVWIITSNLVVRYCIFSRVGILQHYFSVKAQSINLDWVIYKLSALIIVIQAIMLAEYMARHLFGFNILIIYHSYPYLIRCVSVFAIWAIFHESNKLLIPKLIKA